MEEGAFNQNRKRTSKPALDLRVVIKIDFAFTGF